MKGSAVGRAKATAVPRPVDIHGLDNDLLDCLDDNIAALLRHHGVADVRSPFGCQWFFGFPPPAPQQDGRFPLPVLRHQPLSGILAAGTGFRLATPDVDAGGEERFCAEMLGDGRPVIVQGDAFLMPWLPYYGRQHMNHSFIVEAAGDGVLTVADAYYNKTEWGEAAPARTVLPSGALQPLAETARAAGEPPFLMLEPDGEPRPLDVAGVLRQNTEQIRFQLGERKLMTAFSRHYADAITAPGAAERFSLACWLIARDRALHARWLGDLAAAANPEVDTGFAEAFTERVAAPWQQAVRFSYLLQRRIQAGKAAPDSAFRQIEHEIEPAEIEMAGLLGRAQGADPAGPAAPAATAPAATS